MVERAAAGGGAEPGRYRAAERGEPSATRQRRGAAVRAVTDRGGAAAGRDRPAPTEANRLRPAAARRRRGASMIARLPLRDRLLALRRGALAQLTQSDQADAGMLELVAHAGDALAAIDAETMQAIAPIPGDRALIVDDNVTVQIVVYSADRQAACATLSPAAAIRLAGQLL